LNLAEIAPLHSIPSHLNLSRHLPRTRDIESFRLKELQVRSETSRLPVALDGEVEMMHPPLRYRTRPGALRVIVP
jgi:diacylglycerol kinase family enzyme